jgi:hypothetical protein
LKQSKSSTSIESKYTGGSSFFEAAGLRLVVAFFGWLVMAFE